MPHVTLNFVDSKHNIIKLRSKVALEKHVRRKPQFLVSLNQIILSCIGCRIKKK